ncbi:potassium uptake protein, TrkH family [Aeromicrobium marinum DSM 15272]|uniref:Potassium uptake protein, TrkH family n=1 Tax=Aeromicrobium marinum DSM 15272 TaxID=585531 RepID=E2SB60_9ACTN|nr:potassium transporter TrkG [Aeromicrobium marinum]EFQ83606.1 potassium uptake protein, TrkH family [Aeromicrobium marinum DSM 15272]
MRRPAIPAAIAHPVRLLPLSFLALITLGTLLLLMPFARSGGGGPEFMPALFTSTSAVTITGLASVDTSTYWSPAGQGIILFLVQVGGLGIVAMATVLGLFIGGRLGLRTQMVAQVDMHVVSLGEVRPLFRRVAITMLLFQTAVTIMLTARYRATYFDDFGTSLWHGVFHGVMAFNNAGFSLNSDSLVGYAGDGLIILPICVGVFFGAMGFPVLAELFRGWRRPSRWTIHARLTVWGSLFLLGSSAVAFLLLEWGNPDTLGPLSWGQKLVSGLEGGIMPRSGGLNSFDWGGVRGETLTLGTILMFIGGGSASMAGGIKITTFLLLAYVILAELRGDPDVTVGVRRISAPVIRTALTIALLAVMLVTSATMAVMLLSGGTFEDVLFECTSAFATAGLSTGLTPDLPASAQMVLVVLMFVGRVGTIAAASAFVLRRRVPRYHLPEEQPIIG